MNPTARAPISPGSAASSTGPTGPGITPFANSSSSVATLLRASAARLTRDAAMREEGSHAGHRNAPLLTSDNGTLSEVRHKIEPRFGRLRAVRAPSVPGESG